MLGTTTVETPPRYERTIGDFGSTPGPRVVCVAGIHGNEPAGVRALERVFATLRAEDREFHGRLVGIAGNLAALRAGDRYLDEDLNRAWSERRVSEIRRRAPASRRPEENEVVELDACLEDAFEGASDETSYFLDLHTTSAPSAPFGVLGDTLRNRRFAMAFPVPIILGLEEQIDGSIDEYQSLRGRVTFAFEAGQHDDPSSIATHEAAIWVGLQTAGCLGDDSADLVRRARATLQRAARGLPRVFEILHREPIVEGDGFSMKPGFANFVRIERDTLLATNHEGEIRAPLRGRVFMPLYQSQGSDGFFIARRVHTAWLHVSSILRHLRVHRIAHWLPGVTRHPDRPGTLIVNRRVARWFVTEIFHLLGYRKERPGDGHVIVSRRAHDI